MELPQIGDHCQLDNCNSLDFLPIACPLCNKIFCGDHRLPLSHNCLQWAKVDKQLVQCDICQNLVQAPPSEKKSPQEALVEHKSSSCKTYLYPPNSNSIKKINRDCTVSGCHDIDPRIGAVHCNGCNHDFCLRHRHPSSHHCTSLDSDEQRKLDRKIAAQEKVAKSFTTNTSEKTKQVEKTVKKPSLVVKSKKGSMVELMKMKSSAKGDPNTPLSERIYFYVQGPKELSSESKKDLLHSVYFDKKNSVGRMLDSIAQDVVRVSNKNNTLAPNDPERLELYKYPEMTPLLDKSLHIDKVLENLDTLLLERQGSTNTVTTKEE